MILHFFMKYTSMIRFLGGVNFLFYFIFYELGHIDEISFFYQRYVKQRNVLCRLLHGNNDDRNNPFSCFKLDQNSSWFDFSQKNILDIKGNDIGLEREFLTQLFTKTIFPIYVLLLFPIFPFSPVIVFFTKKTLWVYRL